MPDPLAQYLSVAVPEPHFATLCGVCGLGASQRLDDVYDVLASLLQAQQRHSLRRRRRRQAKDPEADQPVMTPVLAGRLLQRLVSHAVVLMDATANAKEAFKTTEYARPALSLKFKGVPAPATVHHASRESL